MMRLPVGYRFWPTDEELLEHYLKRKVFDLPLPPSLIPQFDVFLTHPSALPGDLKEKRFFFTKQKKSSSISNKRRRINVGCGIWKSIGKQKLIVGMKNQLLIGLKNTMVFYDQSKSSPTRWVMHEYTLLPSVSASASATTPNSTQMDEDDWAVYCLFEKRRRPKKQQAVAMEENGSSCSSGLTQISSNATDHEEENTSALTLSFT